MHHFYYIIISGTQMDLIFSVNSFRFAQEIAEKCRQVAYRRFVPVRAIKRRAQKIAAITCRLGSSRPPAYYACYPSVRRKPSTTTTLATLASRNAVDCGIYHYASHQYHEERRNRYRVIASRCILRRRAASRKISSFRSSALCTRVTHYRLWSYFDFSFFR